MILTSYKCWNMPFPLDHIVLSFSNISEFYRGPRAHFPKNTSVVASMMMTQILNFSKTASHNFNGHTFRQPHVAVRM